MIRKGELLGIFGYGALTVHILYVISHNYSLETWKMYE